LQKPRAVLRTSVHFAAAALLLVAVAGPAQSELPRFAETSLSSPSGSFLAARIARAERDVTAASAFYRSVLRTDPKNPDLVELAFLLTLQSGAVEEAIPLAERLIALDRSHRIGRLALGVKALKSNQFAQARTHLAIAGQGPIADLVATMLMAWSWHGSNNTRAGVAQLEKLTGPEWYAVFKDLHSGLMLDLANQRGDALRLLERARKLDPTALRTVDAYARTLSRNGQNDEALKAYTSYGTSLISHPLVAAAVAELGTIRTQQPVPVAVPAQGKLATLILNRSAELIGSTSANISEIEAKFDKIAKDTGRAANWRTSLSDLLSLLKIDPNIRAELAKEFGYTGNQNDTARLNSWLHAQIMQRIAAGGPRAPVQTATQGTLAPLVNGAASGAAEALYGLGAALSQEAGGEDLGMVYLQLAIYLDPEHPLALVALGSLFENTKKHASAIETYERVSENSPLKRKVMIQHALNLDVLDRKDEARERLKVLAEENPKDIEGLFAYANVLRAGKRYTEAADVYSKIVAILGEPKREHWSVYYYRGMSYERAKQWPLAEKDFQLALKLTPDNPQVLNYLGYSWVDQGVNLDPALEMIRKAVALRPKDGYIVDSLGWAYYRLGRFEEAAAELEKAIALSPSDPTINDHLGDAYWKTDRKLEARFQWARAIEMKPEAEDLPKIEKKLKEGLLEESPPRAEEQKNPDKG